MPDTYIPPLTSDVNTEQSVNTENYSGDGHKNSAGDRLAFHRWASKHGLVDIRRQNANLPGPTDYEHGRDVRLEPDGRVIYTDNGTPFDPQPQGEEAEHLRQSYEEITKTRPPLGGVRPLELGSLPEQFLPALKGLGHDWPGVVVHDPEAHGPLPKHVRLRTFYLYPATADRSKIAVVVCREDFVAGHIGKDGRPRPKDCIPWFPYAEKSKGRDAGSVFWLPGLPAKETGYKTPLFYMDSSIRQKVMLHEGEKACLAAIEHSKRKQKAEDNHPLQGFLAEFTHMSAQGGAFMGAPYRADLTLLTGTNGYLMPDADNPGYKWWAFPLQGLLTECKSVHTLHWGSFGEVVPDGFDLADPWPAGLDAAEVEKAFDLAERAFELVEWEDKDKKRHESWVIREQFVKKFYTFGTKKNRLLVEKNRPTIMYSSETFGATFRSCDNRPVASRGKVTLLAAMENSDHFRGRHKTKAGLRPGGTLLPNGDWRTSGTEFRLDGEAWLNTYDPPSIREAEPKPNLAITHPTMAGGKRPWRDTSSIRPLLVYMRHLIPNAFERKMLLRWACHNLNVTEPDQRLNWAAILVSTVQGTGKSVFGQMLAELVGWSNTAVVDGNNVEDQFNNHVLSNLILVEELRNSDNSFKLADKMKLYITGAVVPLRMMNTDRYNVKSCSTTLAMSNYESALKISNDDRRWFFPKVTNSVCPEANSPLERTAKRYIMPAWSNLPIGVWWWKGVLDHFRRHRGALLWWFRRYGWSLRTIPRIWVVKGKRLDYPALMKAAVDHAPETEMKKIAKVNSAPPVERGLREFLAAREAVDDDGNQVDDNGDRVFDDNGDRIGERQPAMVNPYRAIIESDHRERLLVEEGIKASDLAFQDAATHLGYEPICTAATTLVQYPVDGRPKAHSGRLWVLNDGSWKTWPPKKIDAVREVTPVSDKWKMIFDSWPEHRRRQEREKAEEAKRRAARGRPPADEGTVIPF